MLPSVGEIWARRLFTIDDNGRSGPHAVVALRSWGDARRPADLGLGTLVLFALGELPNVLLSKLLLREILIMSPTD